MIAFRYHDKTIEPVKRALEKAYAAKCNVRLFFGDTQTGHVWPDEHDVYGKIGRSTGPVHVPLIIEPRRDGGPHILDHCIVGIVRAGTDGRWDWLYRHEKFNCGKWTVEPITTYHMNGEELLAKGYTHQVRWTITPEDEGSIVHANVKGEAAAKELRDFMAGEQMIPPQFNKRKKKKAA